MRFISHSLQLLFSKRKQEPLFLLLDFKKEPTKEALVRSKPYASAIVELELDRKIKQTPTKIFKFDGPMNFRRQVANSHLKKPTATSRLEVNFGDHNFHENFAVIENLPGVINWLYFTSTTHGLIYFPPLRKSKKPVADKLKKPICPQ